MLLKNMFSSLNKNHFFFKHLNIFYHYILLNFYFFESQHMSFCKKKFSKTLIDF